MWRYRAVLPLRDGESPSHSAKARRRCTSSPKLAREIGVARLWVKDEGLNPTASFKARGMSAAVTRAAALGVPGLVVPTAGNAGAALAAYAAAAGTSRARLRAARRTPSPILATIRALGADLQLVDGHIGDAGKQSRAFAAEHGYFDISTLREPYRIEGKKTMGIELAEQLDWTLPTHVDLSDGRRHGADRHVEGVRRDARRRLAARATSRLPRMVVAQATGCAPMVRAFEAKADRATPWENPETHASGLRVPGPLGDRLILRALLREQRRRRGGGRRHDSRARRCASAAPPASTPRPRADARSACSRSSCARSAFQQTPRCSCSTREAARRIASDALA